MNNAFSYQNDLTGFRSQIANDINKHDNIIALARSRAVGKKNELIQKARDVQEKGQELVKQGLEGVAIQHAGKSIYKGGKAIVNALRNRGAASMQPENDQIDSNNVNSINSTSRGDPEDGFEDQNVDTGQGVEMTGGPTSQPVEGTATETSSRAFGEIDENTLTNSSPFTQNQPRSSDITQRVGNAEEEASQGAEQLSSQGEELSSQAQSALSNVGEQAENSVSNALESGRGAISEAADGVSDAVDALTSGASDAAGALAGVLGETTAEGAAAAGISALATATGATAWIPFVGEVMGGITTAAALGAAGYGLYEEITGGDAVNQAENSKLNIPAPPKLNVGGSFIAPQQTSVEI